MKVAVSAIIIGGGGAVESRKVRCCAILQLSRYSEFDN